MDTYILYLLSALAVAVLLLVITKLRKAPKKGGDAPEREPGPRAVPLNRDAAPVRARRRGAQQRLAAAARRQQDSDEDEENEDIAAELGKYEGKIGAKKMRKLQDKADRKAQREAEFHEREEKKERDARLEAQRKKDEAKQAAEEKAQEEEAQLLKEEQERKEHEEYLLLKQAFTVDEEGTENTQEGEDSQSLLQAFIDFIKNSKVVMLEDLAAHFQIKTQDAIDRINSLLEDGQLSGVMDDRGKFIFITQAEYEAVARFIKQRGRVSLSELAESSNRLINMNPEQTASRAETVK